MDKKTLIKYIIGALILLAVGYGLGRIYYGSRTKMTVPSSVPGAAPFDAAGKAMVYPTVSIISGPIRENRLGQNLVIMEIGSSTPNLAGTPLVRWVTVGPDTVLNRAVQKDKGVELEKIKQSDLQPGDKVTVDASPSNIRIATEFTAASITLDLKPTQK
jgi:hypothetical protein